MLYPDTSFSRSLSQDLMKGIAETQEADSILEMLTEVCPSVKFPRSAECLEEILKAIEEDDPQISLKTFLEPTTDPITTGAANTFQERNRNTDRSPNYLESNKPHRDRNKSNEKCPFLSLASYI